MSAVQFVSGFRQPFPELPDLDGIRLHVGAPPLEVDGSNLPCRLWLAEMECLRARAVVSTRHALPAAPIQWMEIAHRSSSWSPGRPHVLIVNSGNANAATGQRGLEDCECVAKTVRDRFFSLEEDPYASISMASTGLIGEYLDLNPIRQGLGVLERADWNTSARSIMTTDTRPKGSAASFDVGGRCYDIVALAKGSGMIEPNLATMLAFVFTNAPVSASLLETSLQTSVSATLNCITVDGDMSTNDTVMAFAIGEIGRAADEFLCEKSAPEFNAALTGVLADLSRQIVDDGEGSGKYITVQVSGTGTAVDAQAIARSVANSPLVKTAIAGGNPNWGRIIMAIGNAGVQLDPGQVDISMCGIQVARGGCVCVSDIHSVTSRMRGRDIEILVRVGTGPGTAKIDTCDFTKDYIEINAHYRT